MPGLDHEVHPATVGGDRYTACQNKVRKKGYWARTVVLVDGFPPGDQWKWIKDTSSKECRYDMSLTDTKCEGCARQGQGEEYDQLIRSRGT